MITSTENDNSSHSDAIVSVFSKSSSHSYNSVKNKIKVVTKNFRFFFVLLKSPVVSLPCVELQTFPSLCRIFQNQFVRMQICIHYTCSGGKQFIFYLRMLCHMQFEIVQLCHNLLQSRILTLKKNATEPPYRFISIVIKKIKVCFVQQMFLQYFENMKQGLVSPRLVNIASKAKYLGPRLVRGA